MKKYTEHEVRSILQIIRIKISGLETDNVIEGKYVGLDVREEYANSKLEKALDVVDEEYIKV